MRQLLSIVAIALAVCGGCNRSGENTAAGKPNTTGSTKEDAAGKVASDGVAEVEREAVVDLGSVPVVEKDDPNASGWQSESFASAAALQLKHLGQIAAQIPSNTFSIESIVDEQCMVGSLRPAKLNSVYSDANTIVRRGDDAAPVTTQDLSPSTFEEQLVASLRDLKIKRKLRSKFKIFDVQLMGDQASTRSYVHFSGNDESSRAEQNAIWTCKWTDVDSEHPRIRSIHVSDYEETIVQSTSEPFIDKTRSVFDGQVFRTQLQHGVDYWLDRIAASLSIDIGGWQGVSVGDVNGDDLDDVYICQPGGLPNRLYIQNADGTARETSASAGVDWVDSSHGALIADLDNDGDQDLAISVSSGVVVMENDGTGKFRVAALKVMPAAIPYSIAAADYDQDGDLDLLVCCYNRRGGVNQHLLFARPIPYHDANNGGRNVLLRNDHTPSGGTWIFGYATGKSGLDRMNNRRFSYAATWEDYDDDGDLDVYIANDFGRNNLYRNDNGQFVDVAPESNVEDIGPGMSACWGDYDNDGRMDLYVSNMFSSAGNRITGQNQFQTAANQQTRGAFRRHARGNSLFHNLGGGVFEDVSVDLGVDLGRWAWGSRFADLNNDGWQDLIVTNGFVTQEDTGDL